MPVTLSKADIGDLSTAVIALDSENLGAIINNLISDVGLLQVITRSDVKVYMDSDKRFPTNVYQCLMNGSKFFDSIYWMAIPANTRPPPQAHDGIERNRDAIILDVKRNLLWMALFLMLRGSYPSSENKVKGTDVPGFLVNMLNMDVSPLQVASKLATFDLRKVPTDWVYAISWGRMAPSIRQRLAIGLAGTRLLRPFKLFKCKDDATKEAKEAYNWVKRLANSGPHWGLTSIGRSALLTARLGSLNMGLSNLILECFTTDDIALMTSSGVNILYANPTKNPNGENWRSWASQEIDFLGPPINLDLGIEYSLEEILGDINDPDD